MSQKDINMLRNELETQIAFADSLARELGAIMNRSENGRVLKKDEKRAKEIEELLQKKAEWVKNAQKKIKAFYRPAA